MDEEEDNKHGAPASAQGRNMMGPRSLPSRPHHSRDLSDHGMHSLKRPSSQPFWRPPLDARPSTAPSNYLIPVSSAIPAPCSTPSARRTSGRTDGRTDVRRHQVVRPATDLCLRLARSAAAPNRITFDESSSCKASGVARVLSRGDGLQSSSVCTRIAFKRPSSKDPRTSPLTQIVLLSNFEPRVNLANTLLPPAPLER